MPKVCWFTFFLDCTPDQIQAKLEYLEKNILLLRCECEVIELNSIKAQPELAAISKILISLISLDPYYIILQSYRYVNYSNNNIVNVLLPRHN